MPKITVSTTVKASAERVWTAWTTPEHINHWNAASDDWHNPGSRNDLRAGGRFSYRMEARDGSMGFDFEGSYTRVLPGELIEYVMDDARAVSVHFQPGPDGITITETFDAEDVHSAEQQREGWQAILDRFRNYVESAK